MPNNLDKLNQTVQIGPRCAFETLDSSQAQLLDEDKMLVAVEDGLHNRLARDAFTVNKLPYKDFVSQLNEDGLHRQPLIGQRRNNRFVSLKNSTN